MIIFSSIHILKIIKSFHNSLHKSFANRQMTMARLEHRFFEWNPVSSFFGNVEENQYIVIILNRPIHMRQPQHLYGLWRKATFRVTVDGGANQWLDWLRDNAFDKGDSTSPDLICGDMDSIKKETVLYFLDNNPYVQVLKYEDSTESDFTQALVEIKQYLTVTYWNIKNILVICETSGRIDHILSNIHTLFKAKIIIPGVNVYMYSNTSLSWLLPGGNHKLHIPKTVLNSRDWCSLMPLGNPCLVYTEGLTTNFNNVYLSYGQRISTSNSFLGDPTVIVRTSDTIVWSMGMTHFDFEKEL